MVGWLGVSRRRGLGVMGTYSLKTFSKSKKYLCELAIYMSDVKKSNSWTSEEVHKKGT